MTFPLSSAPRTAARLLRLAVPFAVMAGCLWLLQVQSDLPPLDELGTLVFDLPAWKWAGAALATAVSFWALGRYDCVAHRHLGTGLDGPAARRAGMAAIAFSQTAGFGLITGSYARWRLLPGLTPLQAGQLTALVAATFLASLAVICGASLIAAPPVPGLAWAGALILLTAAALAACSFLIPQIQLFGLPLRWPSLTAMTALGFWAAADVAAAGTALWLLLPSGTGVAWGQLLTAYAVALGLAVVSSAPGGAGPFELALCALLPAVPDHSLIAALLAFRVIYYAIPAVIAGFLLVFPGLLTAQKTAVDDTDLLGSRGQPAAALPWDRCCAETGIIRQNGGRVHAFGLNRVALLDSAQASVALFDPLSGLTGETFAPLARHARRRNAAACCYKCGARTALLARKSGWKVLRIAEEAVLDPRAFSENGSSRRQLRRKLRHAEKTGIDVYRAVNRLPFEQMQEVDSAWQSAHGTAYGTTMGRFEPGYLACQEVILAFREGQLIGFASFHTSAREWCLDLIRLRPDVPDGASHALVRAGIAAAAADGIPRLSLAAVPDHRLAKGVDRGLRRFKECFAPRWEPRYMAAPGWLQMAISIAELLRLVHRPPPVLPAAAPQTHNEDEENEIALARPA
ncbi:phosphatidylglycerol lysyltransferase domain-containing protein [Leisingera aquaemixtae]|uniref:phosphatidylglycerol lysyltransferase domain-containing protein n=1 Tax=Leisingera aquaemixtae TaxID=1396826 RepID=UPI0021A703BC|nr:phosphatidylglycerol lysyltransferase domain-containing protein [Leisingera aquaemixtae]UWQ35820.1 phosphatidylglycerol lysyltransferase domain-containing protein [Leisingera aquaemixtae]